MKGMTQIKVMGETEDTSLLQPCTGMERGCGAVTPWAPCYACDYFLVQWCIKAMVDDGKRRNCLSSTSTCMGETNNYATR